jgi:serine/threonine-protein kinase
VDSAHTVYVADARKNMVFSLADKANTVNDLGFTGLNQPSGLVVRDGIIYVADSGNNRVLTLRPGSSSPPTPLPFTGLTEAGGLTVDSVGAVYVTDRKRNLVLKLPPGVGQPVTLPFKDLDTPWGLAVGDDGTVYVAGHNNKILTLQQPK